MTAPTVIIHLYPGDVPSVVETPLGFDPMEAVRIAEQLDQGATVIVSHGYDVQFCRHTEPDHQGILPGAAFVDGIHHG